MIGTPASIPIVPVNLSPSHLPALDGLRGMAVLAVMAYHFGVPFGQHGFLGVDAFFVLSGYLITSILVGEWQRSGKVAMRKFYVRRVLRLLPALWLVLMVLSPIAPTRDLLASSTYAINWTMALHLLPVDATVGHMWSLAVEWQYYLIWPPVLIFALRKLTPGAAAFLTIGLGLASASWRAVLWQFDPDWFRVFTGSDTHADGLLIGSAVGFAGALSLPPLTAKMQRGLQGATIVSILLFAMLVVLPSLPWGFFAVVGDVLAAVATATIIVRVAFYPVDGIGRVLTFGPLVKIGAISYGLYLWHVPLWERMKIRLGRGREESSIGATQEDLSTAVVGTVTV